MQTNLNIENLHLKFKQNSFKYEKKTENIQVDSIKIASYC